MEDSNSILDWKTIESIVSPYHRNYDTRSTIRRAKVKGGWLIDKTIEKFLREDDFEHSITTSITFIPDKNHDWE